MEEAKISQFTVVSFTRVIVFQTFMVYTTKTAD